ncbi:GFA family protein [Methylovulum psychrotolerans]|jgi:hypothetical protein|uniref:GFA family protein n=1 Tax=Methylovulum psychrotolerans TaxID=1704499 RepID=A0A2S5CNU5_9GAMM|nr:GFA family protein [Methylovulum psychrotolerans]POZ52458.1 GFA family protein [Methylovulum psychrotolerans]
MYKGSCLCGAVQYELQGDLGAAVYCHCSRCRKASGSAFASNAPVSAALFRLVEGTDQLKAFSTPEGVHRYFCSVCGSPIYSQREQFPDVLRLRLGTLDTVISQGPQAHIYVGSKAQWYDIHDDLPQHPERAV